MSGRKYCKSHNFLLEVLMTCSSGISMIRTSRIFLCFHDSNSYMMSSLNSGMGCCSSLFFLDSARNLLQHSVQPSTFAWFSRAKEWCFDNCRRNSKGVLVTARSRLEKTNSWISINQLISCEQIEVLSLNPVDTLS